MYCGGGIEAGGKFTENRGCGMGLGKFGDWSSGCDGGSGGWMGCMEERMNETENCILSSLADGAMAFLVFFYLLWGFFLRHGVV